MKLTGACHCGGVIAALETVDPALLQVRACDCSFCRRHGAKTVADPEGRLVLTFNENDVTHYRFGLRTADFLICKTCGNFVAAVKDNLAVLNAMGVGIAFLSDRAATTVSLESEDVQVRDARQRSRWMPVVLEAAQ